MISFRTSPTFLHQWFRFVCNSTSSGFVILSYISLLQQIIDVHMHASAHIRHSHVQPRAYIFVGFHKHAIQAQMHANLRAREYKTYLAGFYKIQDATFQRFCGLSQKLLCENWRNAIRTFFNHLTTIKQLQNQFFGIISNLQRHVYQNLALKSMLTVFLQCFYSHDACYEASAGGY